MLKYNSFRSLRYLRSRFVEGKYLLASEGSDLELEIIDRNRDLVRKSIGDVAIEDAFKLTLVGTNQVLVSPGEAWFDGLPFFMKDGRDETVGSNDNAVGVGLLPLGVTVHDSDGGKLITFSDPSTAQTTPTGLYRIVITAKEQVITVSQDPFLQNINLTETTAQKIRLVYTINVVLDSDQTSTPSPYTNDGVSGQNLTNSIVITPATSGSNGAASSPVPIVGFKQVDGRSYDVTINNNPALLPLSPTDQVAFAHGSVTDTRGQVFHLVGLVPGNDSNHLVLRLDAEVNQPAPIFDNNGTSYVVTKSDVYVTDDTSGIPTGKLFWSIGTTNWDSVNQFIHSSTITDLRDRIISSSEFQKLENKKSLLTSSNEGLISLGVDGQTLNWASDFNLVGPSTPTQIIPASSALIVPNGNIIYELDLASGGSVARGTLSLTISSNSGTLTSFSGSPNLSSIKIGNTIQVGSQSSYIVAIDNVNKTVTVNSALTNTGSATIYLDSYGPNTYTITENTYVLAANTNGSIWVADKLILYAGQSAYLGAAAGSGLFKVTFFDPISTTLPTGSSVTIDGIAGANGDTVLYTNLGSGNNEVYELTGVGTSIVWTPIKVFDEQIGATTGDLVVISKGVVFNTQIAEYNGTTFVINNPVRYFNGASYWEQSPLQTATLTHNSSGNIFSIAFLNSENIIVDFSIYRGGIKETGTLWLTTDGINAFISTGGVYSGASGVSFAAAISGSNLELQYTIDNASVNDVIFKYSVKRWSDSGTGPAGLTSYSSSPATVTNSAFVMSNNSGAPLNCGTVFNVLGKTRVTLGFIYNLDSNIGTTVGDLDVYVNGQRMPRYVAGVTLDGFYKEILNNTIEFHTDLTITPVSIEIVKKV